MEVEELWLGICPIQNIHKIKLIEEFGTAKRLLEELLSNEKYFLPYPLEMVITSNVIIIV